MAQHRLDISELDFENIKGSLKRFLSNQNEFKDYDFEGSSMAILLDLLAYNTHYLAYNANFVANEMFMDTAQLRSSVASLAKLVGYTPNSARAPIADLKLVINDGTGATITIPAGTKFTSSIDGLTYTFVSISDKVVQPIDGVYTCQSLDVYEGTYVTYNYTNDVQDIDQRFLIPSDRADTTTIKCVIQNSASDTTQNTYTLATSITELDSTSKVFFLQEAEDGQYEIYFGDGVIGKKLDDGNIINISYVVTNKTEANAASSFALSGSISGFTDITLTVNSNAQGGADPESLQSIKFNAPNVYASQDRAVTVEDYKAKVKQLYANSQSVSAWGGEDAETPFYGRVYISILPISGSNLTDATKDRIVKDLKKYSVASVTPVIIDPETTNILLTTTVKFDEGSTPKTSETIKSNVVTTLTDYNANTLQSFDTIFRYSKLSSLIDDTDASILSNITTVKLRKSFVPTIGTSTKYTINFSNALYNPHSGHNATAGGIVSSTGFKIEGDTTNIWYLDDDGAGNIRRYRQDGSVRAYGNSTQGTIDYSSGKVEVNSLNVSNIENVRGVASTVIEVTVKPNSNDIVPIRNQVLDMDIANSTVTVEADTLVGGSANAGIGYTTTSSY
tara:strand:- start:45442 stop:47298 length:1857 start_codon:yes stop_codon:yes gene_type:complete